MKVGKTGSRMFPRSGRDHEAAATPPPISRLKGGSRSRLTAGVAGETLALAGGGIVRQQRVLLVVAVDGAGGDDVVLVLIHQGQLGVVIDCSKQKGGGVGGGTSQTQQPGTNKL